MLFYDWKITTGKVYRDGDVVGEVRTTKRHGGDWYIAVVDGQDGDGWTQREAILKACPQETVYEGRSVRSMLTGR